jgi:hypothetical protein
LGTSRRAKQIDSSETEIAMTPIAMPVAGLPWSNSRKINVDIVCIPGGRNKTDPTSSRKETEKIKIAPARQCGQSSGAMMRLVVMSLPAPWMRAAHSYDVVYPLVMVVCRRHFFLHFVAVQNQRECGAALSGQAAVGPAGPKRSPRMDLALTASVSTATGPGLTNYAW